MKAKREYYKNHVTGKVRIRKLIYFLVILTTFGIVLYDSFTNRLPFHYILFFFIGRFMSLVLQKTQKVEWIEMDNKFTIERSFIGIVIIAAVIVLRLLLFPKILTEFNVIFISDALLLLVMGWFIGRIRLLSGIIEEQAFLGFMKNRQQAKIRPE